MKPKLAWQNSMFSAQASNFTCHPSSKVHNLYKTPKKITHFIVLLQLQPFMYSYPKHDNRNRSLMQVPGSDWSQPLSFEAVRSANDVTMATAEQSEDYHVGIHVQEGAGKVNWVLSYKKKGSYFIFNLSFFLVQIDQDHHCHPSVYSLQSHQCTHSIQGNRISRRS